MVHDEYVYIRDIFKEMARGSLIDFVSFINPNYEVRWFHRLIADKVDKLLNGEIQNLMVFMPGQHGKSTIVSQALPAYALGKRPDFKIALCTYAASLSESMNRTVQRIMGSNEYQELFPDSKIGGKGYIRTNKMFEISGNEGSFRSVGIGGALSGFRVDLGTIDDPVKSMEEAVSEKMRNTTWEWYNSVYRIRCHNGTRTLLTNTRWHEDDLAGRILQKESDDWEVISLPYINEEGPSEIDPRNPGEALWEDRHSAKKAMSIRRNSERIYQAMCQQSPVSNTGLMFKEEYFNYYYSMPTRFDNLIQSWDCSFKGSDDSDYVVGTVWGQLGKDLYLLAMIRDKMDFTKTVRAVREVSEAYPYTNVKLVEDKANGSAIISTLKREIQGIVPITPHESKESRAYACSFQFEAGNVYFPHGQPWVDTVKNELKAFPNGKHDDIVDSVTQAIRWLAIRRSGKLIHMGHQE